MLAVFFCLCIGAQTAFAAQAPRYRVTVNTAQNIVTVYEKTEAGEKALSAFVCSVGEGTPHGTFYTTDQYRWRLLFGDVYGQYATRITGHILFHSVPYTEQSPDTLEYEEYNKLGTTASMGCIRLTVEDAKWIYENCPAGTEVTIFASEQAEPLTPEAPQKIDPADERRGWDPTDDDPMNPWNKTESLTLKKGEKTYRMEVLTDADGAYYVTWQDSWVMLDALGRRDYLKTEKDGTITMKQSFFQSRRESAYQPAPAQEGEGYVLFRNSLRSRWVKTTVKDGEVYYHLMDFAAALQIPLIFAQGQVVLTV